MKYYAQQFKSKVNKWGGYIVNDSWGFWGRSIVGVDDWLWPVEIFI